MEPANVRGIVAAIAERHQELRGAYSELSEQDLRHESRLPGWDRMTILCHLRYGAEASDKLTADTVAGRETSFYPDGRDQQRPVTLQPRAGEDPADVVASFAAATAKLDERWQSLDPDHWNLVATEPSGNADLGPVGLPMVALLRLTEVEVHGSDVDLGLRPWSDVFVDAALPMRVGWLPTRRSNHGLVDDHLYGRWLLQPNDGAGYLIASTPQGVTVSNESSGRGDTQIGDTQIRGTKRDLLAFMLGRLNVSQLAVSGEHKLAAAFHEAFPAP